MPRQQAFGTNLFACLASDCASASNGRCALSFLHLDSHTGFSTDFQDFTGVLKAFLVYAKSPLLALWSKSQRPLDGTQHADDCL
jgi:hypothetical protein